MADLEATSAQRAEQFAQLLDWARAAGRPYDCLVPLSGGKDSTYVLYLCSQVYKLKCLCVTLDNGYLSQYARSNIESALRTIGADHVIYRVDRYTMIDLYRLFLEKCGMFCPACNRGIGVTMQAIARGFRVPLVVTGHGKIPTYLSDGRMPEVFEGGDASFFGEVLRGEPIEDRAAALTLYPSQQTALDRAANRAARLFPRGLPTRAWWSFHSRVRRALRSSGLEKHPEPTVLDLYDYVDAPEDEVKRTLAEEMGWRAPADRYEHIDCEVIDLKVYVQTLKFPELTPTTISHSGLVRAGRMSREEALSIEREQLGNTKVPEVLDTFLSDIGLSRGEFEWYAREWQAADQFRASSSRGG